MGVTAQIVEHILWASEGAFGIDHPVVSEQWPELGGEGLRVSQGLQVSPEDELAVTEGTLETGNKLATKDATEHPDGKKERVV
jgi:hypothetical protein